MSNLDRIKFEVLMDIKMSTSRRANSSKHNLYLGVDGGGTKTHAVIINSEKRVIGEAIAGVSNPLRIGIEKAVNNIFSAIDKACDKAGRSRTDIVSIECGLAGVRREDLRNTIRKLILERFRIKVVEVLTDAEIALYGTTLGKEGIVVIAGTGSICIGQNSKGEKSVAGGWGPLAGDEGGGTGIARRALQAIAKASDGRGKPTILSKVAVDYFRAGKLEDLSVAIYAPHIDNTKISGFARCVIEAARIGDEVALELLEEAGHELGIAANAVIRKLKLERKKFPVGLVGGIFHAGELIIKPLLETIQEVAPKAYVTEPRFSPATAAALMAFENFKRYVITNNGARKS
jgi:N-acetylglucosamine kinase-like BadF-type ATPase